ncbi:MAG: metallophosphoesterase, partial [Streptococcaceae bacterium]|nr:metallophosphoesterase [Streptococcaceae bacterium]
MKKLLKLLAIAALALTHVPTTVSAMTTNVNNATSEGTTINILHTNDIHGRYNNVNGISFAKYTSLINKYRANNPNTLVLDAGDFYHGTNFANLFRGESMVQLMDNAGVDAFVLGNHEFNFGSARVLELQEMTNTPFLSANTFNAD